MKKILCGILLVTAFIYVLQFKTAETAPKRVASTTSTNGQGQSAEYADMTFKPQFKLGNK